MIWDDDKVIAFDFESSGVLPEYALQPWRFSSSDAWLTSVSALKHITGEGLVAHLSQLFPTKEQVGALLDDILANDWTVVGWNLAYDIGLLVALGFTEQAMRIRWLDGMLLWRHLEIEPEYEFASARHKKRRWRLKPEAVDAYIPAWSGLDEDVDFHSTEPESLAKLQKYNDRDNVRAWVITKMI